MSSLLSSKPALDIRSLNSVALLHKMECRACPLNTTKGGKIQPTGSETPLVYMLGEAPSSNEVELQEQFVGEPGQLVRAHIPRNLRSRIRFNNIIRSRPPANAAPETVMIEACRPSITKDIERTKPKAIFGFGNFALQWASEFNGVTVWRGRKMPVKIGKHICWFYPMLSPAILLKQRRGGSASEDERMFQFDLKRAFAEVESLPEAVVHTPVDMRRGVEITNGDLSFVRKALDWAVKQPIIGIDYETNGLRPYAKGAKILSAAVVLAFVTGNPAWLHGLWFLVFFLS